MAFGTLALGRLIRPSRPNDNKAQAYESGAEPTAGSWSQSHVRYYLYALLFVVFDVEVAFIVPWAVQVEALGGFGLVEMLIFVAILALGLVYAWRKDVFTWQ
jgi:NADH-quinone oxidoreductase subunit A